MQTVVLHSGFRCGRILIIRASSAAALMVQVAMSAILTVFHQLKLSWSDKTLDDHKILDGQLHVCVQRLLLLPECCKHEEL